MEKKEIKISLGTVICIFIIVILLIVIGIMYLKMKNTTIKQEEIKKQEEVTNTTDKQKTANQNDDIAEHIKEYILTEFGPKENMESVTIKEVNTKNEDNSNLIYGSCIYSITLKDSSKLTMEGSKSSVDKLEGNIYTLDAEFTYDKTTNKVKFDTSYGFGN